MLIVIEIQTNNGNVATLTWQFDNLREAEAKFFSILSVAAVSALDEHGAVILTNSGTLVRSESFRHGGE